ncbi:Asp/Glu racemase [Gilliamella sp. wkB178]|uniref:aspartate/glutamate racemase family protein n=1 Tax=Gilliamella sp. wkB178 TaxID=3120259 RepID=UPI00080E4A02|nr:aspartate/glutamate racemase family protein [Gilliamella apicola]OCG06901.1 Asp/Glu racemase [Gilliamella apicola]
MKKIALFHTSAATLDTMTKLTTQIIPDVKVMHIVEDSMIKDVMANNGVTPSINARIASYIKAAEIAKCDMFMTACSSIGGVVEQCQFMTSMPLTRIDTAMIEQAIKISGKISVLATVETTLRPTLEYVHRMANIHDQSPEIESLLMAEAFVALLDGDSDKHDEIVKQGLLKALKESDVVILAQASMARVLNTLDEKPTIPVLTSPESGIKWLKEKLLV